MLIQNPGWKIKEQKSKLNYWLVDSTFYFKPKNHLKSHQLDRQTHQFTYVK
jgi:hypothetical protein